MQRLAVVYRFPLLGRRRVAGKRIGDHQVGIYKKLRKKLRQEVAAALVLTLGSAMAGAASDSIPESAHPNTIGNVDQPVALVLTTSANVFSGWALSRSGVARVELVLDGRQWLPTHLGIAREDVRSVHPDYPDNDKAGFEVITDLSHLPLGPHRIEIVATDNAGATTVLGRRTYVDERTSVDENFRLGRVDQPAAPVVTASSSVFSGWALSPSGVARVELVVDGRQRLPARLGVVREDVKSAHPNYPDSDTAGFDLDVDLGHLSMGPHEIEVVVTDNAGTATVLGKRTYLNDVFREIWADLLAARGHRPNEIFHYVFGTSNLALKGGDEIDTEYAPYLSDTVKVGMRVPILYLRTTRGRDHDWVFDPDFDTSRACGERKIAGDSLNGVLRWSVEHQVPVLFTLNGGIWADAACDVPEWDINDHLEEDVANCQWNEQNEVMPDDYLRNLPGSQDAPELARALTFNVHAEQVRHYKKRNLQQAATAIHAFAEAHPNLFIGVSLDADVYMNPFFEGAQWYDYNPGTLRQFREWLRGTGPYAGKSADGAPDLSSHRRAKTYTLAEVNRLARARYRTWDEVDPPRAFRIDRNLLKTPWAAIWEQFRRHLVDLHYDELSQWVAETGIDRDGIFSSQGFGAPDAVIKFEPFPLRIDSPPKSYDTGGMSVQGAVPAQGHLGAILYGESAINNIRMEGRDSLFRVFRDFDPDWAVVEYNTADLKTPKVLPDIGRAYRGLRDIVNFGARLVSPMAWNGSPGSFAGQPGFTAYTSYRAAPLETAVRNFMVNRANLPRQARLWAFGLGIVVDDDGWTASRPASATPLEGALEVTLRTGKTRLDSPSALDFRTDQLDAMIIGIREPAPDLRIEVQARDRGQNEWRKLTGASRVDKLQHVRAGYLISLPHSSRQLEQLRLIFSSRARAEFAIERIALYPVAARR